MSKFILDTDIAYIAGLIDGEGSIMLYYRGGIERLTDRSEVRYTKHNTFTPIVEITNTNVEVLNWIKSILSAGGIYTHIYKTGNRKDISVYRVSSTKDIEWLLMSILPYLRIKKKQAELLLIFCKEHPSGKGKAKPPTEVEIDIYYNLKELNRRGLT